MKQNPALILEDNEACIIVASNTSPIHRPRTRHIAVRFHNVKGAVKGGLVTLKHVWTKHQVADVFTKSLPRSDFERFRGPLMGYQSFDEMCRAYTKEANTPANKATKISAVKNNTSDLRSSKSQSTTSWPKYAEPTLPGSFLYSFLAAATA